VKDPTFNPTTGKRYTVEEFIIKAVKNLPKPPHVGMLVRHSDFQGASINYFGSEFDADAEIERIIEEDKLTSRLSPGDIKVYVPETAAKGKSVNQSPHNILS